MKMRCFILAAVLVCSSIAAAEPLDTLAWLEGHWQTEAFGGTIEEIWLPAAGNAMHGVFRLTVDGKLAFSEFMQVTAVDDQVAMRFEHFNPDYSTWEGDGPPMEMKVTEATTEQVVFEAANEESPDRMVYRLVGEELHVTVTGVDGVLRFQRRR
jgi:hypothetical protein